MALALHLHFYCNLTLKIQILAKLLQRLGIWNSFAEYLENWINKSSQWIVQTFVRSYCNLIAIQQQCPHFLMTIIPSTPHDDG